MSIFNLTFSLSQIFSQGTNGVEDHGESIDTAIKVAISTGAVIVSLAVLLASYHCWKYRPHQNPVVISSDDQLGSKMSAEVLLVPASNVTSLSRTGEVSPSPLNVIFSVPSNVNSLSSTSVAHLNPQHSKSISLGSIRNKACAVVSRIFTSIGSSLNSHHSRAVSVTVKRSEVCSPSSQVNTSSDSSLNESDLKKIVDAIAKRLLRENLWEFEGAFRESASCFWLKTAQEILELAALDHQDTTQVVDLLQDASGNNLINLLKRLCRLAKNPEIFRETQLPTLLNVVCGFSVCGLTEETMEVAFPVSKVLLGGRN